ncbi:MAG TPA: hypothetical protein DD400_00130 [Rhodospirillaceae bacterium]|nr:hypothetical protein [Rhodospirillaceae bacterium]
MSNIIPLFQSNQNTPVLPKTHQVPKAYTLVGSLATIWMTGQGAKYVRFPQLVREIDACSFFADSAWRELDDAYGAALHFLDNLMEDKTFWESL